MVCPVWPGISGRTILLSVRRLPTCWAPHPPWAMAACAAVLLGLGLYQYRKSDTAFHGWDGEDEDVMQRAEERLSWALLLDSLTVIVSFFFFNAGTRSCHRAPMVIRSRCW